MGSLILLRVRGHGVHDVEVATVRDHVARVRRRLRDLGVGRGDRVAAYRRASLGAVFSSCAPEFGARSVQDRWRQIAPKVLVTVTGIPHVIVNCKLPTLRARPGV